MPNWVMVIIVLMAVLTFFVGMAIAGVWLRDNWPSK